ncbi:I78 family peptidase inhibitor [Ramlibacter sp. MAHUQ-53]|uniref:I78 family peptidase inhibitor n=1 Tax=unclassified Ramlibacter TaxID=2617605 RepID=UPI0036432080
MGRQVLNLVAWGLALALPACAQAPSSGPQPASLTGQTVHAATPPNRCEAGPAVKAIVGQRATRELLEQARARAGARILRVIGHDQMVTQEFNDSRLSVLLDAQGRVAEVSCG